jgi:hypothetical protein
MGESSNPCRVMAGKLQGKNHQEDIGVGDAIILIWILKKYNGRM